MNSTDLAGDLRATGRRAVVGVLAGGAWIGWALYAANRTGAAILTLLVLVTCLLLAGCVYCIVKGRTSLARKPLSARFIVNRGYVALSMLEVAGVAGAIAAAQKWDRFDALPDWIGVVIGIHFFGLAKVFRVWIYYWTGAAITLWCVLVWALFSATALTVWAGLGVGSLLWGTATYNLVRVLARSRAN